MPYRLRKTIDFESKNMLNDEITIWWPSVQEHAQIQTKTSNKLHPGSPHNQHDPGVPPPGRAGQCDCVKCAQGQ